jgi:hypothetical protein
MPVFVRNLWRFNAAIVWRRADFDPGVEIVSQYFPAMWLRIGDVFYSVIFQFRIRHWEGW